MSDSDDTEVEMLVRDSASCQSDAAILVAIGVELARREAGDDRALRDGRRGDAEHALRSRALPDCVPAISPSAWLSANSWLSWRHHIDVVVGDRRRAAQRAARAWRATDLAAVRRVERGDVADAVGRIDAAIVDS